MPTKSRMPSRTKSGASANVSARAIDVARRQMLSGDEARYEKARAFIDAHTENIDARALDLFDAGKTWIENNKLLDRHGRDVKKRAFLDKMHADANAIRADLKREHWYARGHVARAYRYCGRLGKARNQYVRAVKDMGPFDGSSLDNRRSDVVADFAEFLAYLGFPSKALEELKAVPDDYRVGWVLWVEAFALHQSAFTDCFPYGTPAMPLGEIKRYRASNNALVHARKTLIAKDTRDTYLLQAANCGGIYRRQVVDGADASTLEVTMKAMSDAICEFRKDPEVGVNLHWSWRKERRGMMVRRYIESIDIPASVNEKKMIADWRTNLVNHLFLNLAAAGLKDRATGSVPEEFGDGEPPNEDDPGDDD